MAVAGLGAIFPAMRAMAATPSRPSIGPDAAAADVIAPLSQTVQDVFATLMRYDPDSDRNAPYFRSTVAIAKRIAPFAATQAHPALDSRPGLATLTTINRTISEDVADDWRAVRHAEMPAGGVQIARHLGMNDVIVQWSGTGIIPNPALTDVAHRNGALCLGTIFQPDARFYAGTDAQVAEVTRKLVRLARYFGFDGYFINHETRGDSVATAQAFKFMTALRAAAVREGLSPFSVEYNDGLTDPAGWFAPAGDDPAANIVMVDQGWSGYSGPGGCCSGGMVDPAMIAVEAEARNHSRFALHYALQLYPGPGYIGVASPSVISPNDGKFAHGGLQTYSLDDGILSLYLARQGGRGAAFLPPDADISMVERLVYSGRTGNPALDNTPSPADDAIYARGRQYSENATDPKRRSAGNPYQNDVSIGYRLPDQADLPITYGLANFIAERSVIGSLPFITHFNLGEGQAFFVEGRQVGHKPWFNLGIQDVLPTWQWWRAPFAGLSDRSSDSAGLLNIEYDQAIAYDGGASLRVHGPLGKRNETRIHLFKTDIVLPTRRGAYIELATRGRRSDRTRSRIGLIFADQPDAVTWLPLDPGASSGADAWYVEQVKLERYGGRRLASLLLGFAAADDGDAAIDIRFGRLAIFDAAPGIIPPAPRALTLDRRIVNPASGAIGLALRWQTTGRFDVFELREHQEERIWIGRIDGNAFYAPTALPAGTGSATIEVQSIVAGVRGRSARLKV